MGNERYRQNQREGDEYQRADIANEIWFPVQVNGVIDRGSRHACAIFEERECKSLETVIHASG